MYSRARTLTRLAAVAAVAVSLSACDIAVDGHGGLGFDLAAGKASPFDGHVIRLA